MSKSYLITGGYGLIGSALANSLNGKVTLLVRSDKNKERVTKNGIKVIKKDLLQITPKDLTGIDVIMHTASTVDNYHVLTDRDIDIDTNLKGTLKLLEACKDLSKKPLVIFFSTFFVYGNTYDKTKKKITEESETDPLAIYPATKLCAESLIKLYQRLYGIPYIIVRPTNVYSDKEDYTNKKKGAFNYMIMLAVKGEPLNVYKGGNFYRDYVYLEDVVSALKFLIRKKVRNETFIIGNGKPVLFKDMINYIHKLTDKKSTINEIDPPEFHKVVGIGNFVADISKINKLGWKSKVGYKEGIERIVKRYQKISLEG
jgi:UDP-glucose 4-epimerase